MNDAGKQEAGWRVWCHICFGDIYWVFVPYAASADVALVGLRVSGSHDPGEIACNLMMLFADMLFVGCDMRPGDTGDEAISESHKYMDLSSVDSSSVCFFLKAIAAFFSSSHSCFLAR